MRIFDHNNFIEQATQFIKDWTRLLAENKFQEAIASLDQPISEENSFVWTIENLKEAFLDYGGVGRMPIINDPYLMNLEGEQIEFYQYNNGSGWAVDYDIPLDGEWGDLTAQFSFKKISSDMYVIRLRDIHIM